LKKPLLQNVFFAAVLVVFFGLIITGGSRLIAAPEQDEMTICAPSSVKASLICPPEGSAQYLLTYRQEVRRTTEDMLCTPLCGEFFAGEPVTDANGNVVMHCSYMRAVYQSFALGDGFV